MYKSTTKQGDTARGARGDVGGGHRGRIPLKQGESLLSVRTLIGFQPSNPFGLSLPTWRNW